GPPYFDIASAYRSGPGKGFGPNWAIFLLPYLEHENLYKSISVASYMESKGLDQSWRNIRGVTVPLFICPSDSGHDVPFNLPDAVTTQADLDQMKWARGNYAANAGAGWFNWSQNGESKDQSANSGNPTNNVGGIMTINWGATLSQVANADGTANTIMFNEVRVGMTEKDRRGVWAMGLAGASVTAANAIGDCITPNDNLPKSDDTEDCQ